MASKKTRGATAACIASPFHPDMTTLPKTVTQDHIDAVLENGCLDLSNFSKLETIEDGVALRSYSMRSVILPASLRYIGNSVVITGARDVDFSRCARLKRIGAWFRASGATRAPLAVDLSNCTALVAIGSGFLAKSFVDNWKDAVHPRTSDSATLHIKSIALPTSIETIGDGFCYRLSTLTATVDLRRCGKLKHFGHRWFVSCNFKELRLPASIETIGNRFCVNSLAELGTMDLGSCPRLKAIGDECFLGSALTSVTLPPSIEALGKRFAATSSALKTLDLSDCPRLAQIKDDFLLESEVETVWLPPNITSIGALFCSKVSGKLTLPDLADCSRLSTIGDAFAKDTALSFIELPDSVTTIGSAFAASAVIDTVSLARCANLTVVPASFLDEATVKTLSLPHSLTSIGDRFCAQSKDLQMVDLGFCESLQQIRDKFLFGSDVNEVMLPASIVSVGDSFCAGLQLASMDLGACGGLIQINNGFLAKTRTSYLCFPPTLVTIGESCCHGATLQECGTVMLPAPLESVGDGFFQQVSGVRDVVQTTEGGLIGTVIGGDFCAGAVDLRRVSLSVAQVGPNFCADSKTLENVSLTFLRAEETRDEGNTTGLSIGANFLSHAGSTEPGSLEVRLMGGGAAVQNTEFAIGESFLSGAATTSVKLEHLPITSIGRDFGRRSTLNQVTFPSCLRNVDVELCTDCPITKLQLPPGVLRHHLQCITAQPMPSFTRQAKALWDRLEHDDRCQFALFFFELRKVLRLCEAVDLRLHSHALRKMGGSVKTPRAPSAPCAALLTMEPVDGELTLLHWATLASRDNPTLLKDKVQWRLDDLNLKATTTQGFTPLHYAVMDGVDGTTLQQLLKTASASAVRATWREASRRSRGSAFSPLHLAIMYHRSELVSIFLEASWSPTERSMPKSDSQAAASAYDLAVLELGLSRCAARSTMKREKTAIARGSEPTPVCIRLTLCALQCVKHLSVRAGKTPFETAEDLLNAAYERRSIDTDAEAHCTATLRAAMALRAAIATNSWPTAQPVSDCLDVTLREPHLQEIATDQTEFVRAFCNAADLPDGLVIDHPASSARDRDRELGVSDGIVADARADLADNADPDSYLSIVSAMEKGPFKDDVAEVLQSVIPYSEVWPVLPFFFMTLLCVFGVSWFYNPPILRTVLTDFEHNITSCIDSFPDRNTLPYSCSETWVSVTELQSSPGTAASVSQYARHGRAFLAENNVTTVTWETMRFEGRHVYKGVIDNVTGDHRIDEYEYWVLSELRRPPFVVLEFLSTTEIGKPHAWKTRHTGARVFTHVVVPVGFGERRLVVCWIACLSILWLGCLAAVVFDARSTFKKRFQGEEEKLLVMPTALTHALRSTGFAGQCAGVLFSGAAIIVFTTLYNQHHGDKQITWEVMGVWVKSEALFRLAIFFSSFRAVSFFRELPKPHHFARGNLVAMLALLGLLGYALSTKSVARFRSFSQVFAADSLISLQTLDAVTLPLIMGVSVFFRTKEISDVVRQQHFYNLHRVFGPAIAGAPPPPAAEDAMSLNSPLRPTVEAASTSAFGGPGSSVLLCRRSVTGFDEGDKEGPQCVIPALSSVSAIPSVSHEPFAEDAHPQSPSPFWLFNLKEAESSWVRALASRLMAYIGARGWQWAVTVCVAFIGQMMLYTVAVLVLFRAILFLPAPGLIVEFGPGKGNDAAADNTKWFKTAASMWT